MAHRHRGSCLGGVCLVLLALCVAPAQPQKAPGQDPAAAAAAAAAESSPVSTSSDKRPGDGGSGAVAAQCEALHGSWVTAARDLQTCDDQLEKLNLEQARLMPAGSLFGHWLLGGYQSPTLVNARNEAQVDAEAKRVQMRTACAQLARIRSTAGPLLSARAEAHKRKDQLDRAQAREVAAERTLLLMGKGNSTRRLGEAAAAAEKRANAEASTGDLWWVTGSARGTHLHAELARAEAARAQAQRMWEQAESVEAKAVLTEPDLAKRIRTAIRACDAARTESALAEKAWRTAQRDLESTERKRLAHDSERLRPTIQRAKDLGAKCAPLRQAALRAQAAMDRCYHGLPPADDAAAETKAQQKVEEATDASKQRQLVRGAKSAQAPEMVVWNGPGATGSRAATGGSTGATGATGLNVGTGPAGLDAVMDTDQMVRTRGDGTGSRAGAPEAAAPSGDSNVDLRNLEWGSGAGDLRVASDEVQNAARQLEASIAKK